MDVAIEVYANLLRTAKTTPVVEACRKALSKKDWYGLAKLKVSPRDYTDARSYYNDARCVAFLKKYQGFPGTSKAAKAVAIENWYDCEAQCGRANRRLARFLDLRDYPFRGDGDRVVADFFADVRCFVGDWIGWSVPLGVPGRFGPGSTFAVRGGDVTILEKIRSRPTMTSASEPHLQDWLWTWWGKTSLSRHGMPLVVNGNRFATVPKTVITDRSIAIEPDINVFYQLGLGRIMRRRLAHHGIDLDRAADVHRELARTSSADLRFNTYDLSNASDTVSKVLVRLCLPPRWFDALNSVRSPMTFVNREWVRLEKFSSMGNGYTFELETIIFAALISAAAKNDGRDWKLGRDIFVFGDDIITPNEPGAHRLVTSVLRFAGLTLNEEKSFFGADPFRESCGGDFFLGEAVRPYYQKRRVDNEASTFSIINGLHRDNLALEGLGVTPSWRTWLNLIDSLRPAYRGLRGPKDLGDMVITDRDTSRWTTKVEHSIIYVKALVPGRIARAWYDEFHPDVVLACALYGTGNSEAGGIPLRDGVRSYKRAWVPFS